jgi:hypothetical protein
MKEIAHAISTYIFMAVWVKKRLKYTCISPQASMSLKAIYISVKNMIEMDAKDFLAIKIFT